MSAPIKDITGKRIGRLVALFATNKRERGSVVWNMQCDCGNKKELSSRSLHAVQSCGCLRMDAITAHGTTPLMWWKYEHYQRGRKAGTLSPLFFQG
jgi:hypothetical protein